MSCKDERIAIPGDPRADMCTNAKISEGELKQYLNDVYEKEASDQCYKVSVAQFDFETDVRNKKKEELTVN
nr:unnamed protein product [Callosobruchus chinensis]